MRRLLSLPLLALVLTLNTLTPLAAAQETPVTAGQPTAPDLGFAADMSFWIESGLAYRNPGDTLTPYLRVGLRALKPLNETVAVYSALSTDGGLGVTLDAGAWYSFLPNADDLFGVRAYAGAGLSTVAGSFGLVLSAAVSYDLSPQTALVLVYTHRPLVLPEWGQTFDVSVGVSYALSP